MPANQPHTYEEIRDVVVDILLGKETTQYGSSQFENLRMSVHEVITRRAGKSTQSFQPSGAPTG